MVNLETLWLPAQSHSVSEKKNQGVLQFERSTDFTLTKVVMENKKLEKKEEETRTLIVKAFWIGIMAYFKKNQINLSSLHLKCINHIGNISDLNSLSNHVVKSIKVMI